MAFLIGLVAVPAAFAAFLLYDLLLSDRPCKELPLGCVGEVLLIALAGAVLAGVLGALASRRVAGWPALLLGLLGGVTAVAVYNGGGPGLGVVAAQIGAISVFFGVPATIAYFVTLFVGEPLWDGMTVPATAADGEAGGVGRYWDGTRWVGTRR
jgi:hypothetical protein